MSLEKLEIPTGKYKCINNVLGKGVMIGPGDVRNLRERGTGGVTYSGMRGKRCDNCLANCPLGGLMARIAEESKSIYPDVE
ncbi:hypothetical protein A2634_03170 [Candidatus Amesbacteria bacterium RIFCSPHIGHO2_01_FULL_48_32]|uniref:4Fe-4S ferredoxin-type domain-containing protein n=1 Tax=Candidatus Amesbacteria bacterium RIFCSPLOWO2_01_FULL_48_25 TaxID=1797259 RepID=A0A1F4ZB58_9BACT|nr:MAG: hypothetical protein A2634_03170 [Candidatus Amesbacteria bacterium RIFCSPHIGHO2_01_FULL_48_32]OGD03590.1 MAG: hypothetical protein A2989_02820 [Candidatus Amesbacteria bacterium RIFCSPLOWO2_01_FULL_48_25]HJZ04690.1 hypothetical protein [Patescibacteria group bacterium]